MVVAEKEGFPNQASSLMKVKGIGEYTAGAIASIAFNEVSQFYSLVIDVRHLSNLAPFVTNSAPGGSCC